MTTLKPCPAGHDASPIEQTVWSTGRDTQYTIECSHDCGWAVSAPTKPKTRTAWNSLPRPEVRDDHSA